MEAYGDDTKIGWASLDQNGLSETCALNIEKTLEAAVVAANHGCVVGEGCEDSIDAYLETEPTWSSPYMNNCCGRCGRCKYTTGQTNVRSKRAKETVQIAARVLDAAILVIHIQKSVLNHTRSGAVQNTTFTEWPGAANKIALCGRVMADLETAIIELHSIGVRDTKFAPLTHAMSLRIWDVQDVLHQTMSTLGEDYVVPKIEPKIRGLNEGWSGGWDRNGAWHEVDNKNVDTVDRTVSWAIAAKKGLTRACHAVALALACMEDAVAIVKLFLTQGGYHYNAYFNLARHRQLMDEAHALAKIELQNTLNVCLPFSYGYV